MLRLGVIGYGLRATYVIDSIMRLGSDVKITAVADLDIETAKKNMTEKGLDPSATVFYADANEMLAKEDLDGVIVGTRCSLHTEMAIKVMDKKIPLFLEKPVATNMDDLLRLRAAGEASGMDSKVVVSFPLRVTPIVDLAKEIIDSGQIGTVEHAQAYNNVPYGAVYFFDWYRDENETGGLFLQKATHDLDYLNYLVGLKPVWLSAMTSKQIYKGDHPAGLKCDDCTEGKTCPESPLNLFFRRFETERVEPSKNKCGFAVDTGNEDSGSVLIEYESGMHLCYSQNFFARREAAKRGATLLGYKGTIEFDWYTNELKLAMHHTPRVATYKVDTSKALHGGGDLVLAENFINVMRGECASNTPLSAGLTSVLLCLKAKESAATRTFQEIKWP